MITKRSVPALKSVSVRHTWSILLSALLILPACNSGGESSGGNGVNIPTKPIAISQSNGQQVATESVSANEGPSSASSTASVSSTTSPAPAPVATTPTVAPAAVSNKAAANPTTDVIAKSTALIKSVLTISHPAGGSISALAVQDCPGGGSATYPNNADGTGDYVFKQCKSNDGTVVDGSMSVAGTFDPFDVTMTFDNLTITSGGETAMIDGDVALSITTNTVVTDTVIDSTSLTMLYGKEGVKLSDFHLADSFDSSQNTGSTDYHYTVSSTSIGGSVHVETTQTLEYPFYMYPTAGQVLITGASNSKVQITVEQGGTGAPTDYVLVEIDADGDGVYESANRVQFQDLSATFTNTLY